MFNKPFFLLLFFLIIIQIAFSFYYSSEIINQNNLIDQNQKKLDSLKLINQGLEEKLSSLTSLNYLQTQNNQNYINLEDKISFSN